MSLHDQIKHVLMRYLSERNADGVLVRALSEERIAPESLSTADLARLRPKLERRARIYLDAVRHARLVADLAAMAGHKPPPRTRSVSIQRPTDVDLAQAAARDVCEQVGARSPIAHRIVTIVTELARNIALHAHGGTIEVTVLATGSSRIGIVASDVGPGIGDLDAILAGRHRSKTGTARGLITVKRLADRCTIDPGPRGVRVEAEIHL